jgi:Bacterial PH domain
VSDFDFEPIPGLPARLPEGERILWQGAPHWQRLSRDVYHVDKVATYFAALLGLRATIELSNGSTFAQMVMATAKAALWMVPLALAAVAILMLLAYLTQRTTIYTITNRRVVMRFGIALPMTINFPFRTIGSVSLRMRKEGFGDIPLALLGTDRVAYPILWPHARPWHVSRPEPMLRSVSDAARVGVILAEAISAAAEPGTVAAQGLPGTRKQVVPAAQTDIPSAAALAS